MNLNVYNNIVLRLGNTVVHIVLPRRKLNAARPLPRRGPSWPTAPPPRLIAPPCRAALRARLAVAGRASAGRRVGAGGAGGRAADGTGSGPCAAAAAAPPPRHAATPAGLRSGRRHRGSRQPEPAHDATAQNEDRGGDRHFLLSHY